MDDSNYWNHSEVKPYPFNEDNGNDTQMCGISLGGAASLAEQVNRGLGKLSLDSDSYSDTWLSSEKNEILNLDINDMFTEKSLTAILEADVYNSNRHFVDLHGENEKEQIRILKRKVAERWSPPNVDTTVKSIFLGRPYTFEMYKTYKEKKELLSAAERLGDGAAILEVVLFLSRTLKKSLFNKILADSNLALNHYILYLTKRMRIEEADDILCMLGRTSDAAMLQFAVLVRSQEKRADRIKTCSTNHFVNLKDKTFVDNFVSLLLSQEEYNIKLRGESSATTLSYLCNEHWKEPKGSTKSPQHFVELHRVSNRLFHWIALNSRAKHHNWEDIYNLFVTKGWIGGFKLVTELPVESILDCLHKNNAPNDVLSTYVMFCDSSEKKLDIAKKFNLHNIFLDS